MKSKRFTVVALISICASLVLSACTAPSPQAPGAVKPLTTQGSTERAKAEPTAALSAPTAPQAAASDLIGLKQAAVATVPVGSSPNAVGVNPTTNRVYVANYDGNTVSVIDGTSNTVVATVPVGSNPSNPSGVGVNPTTNRIYVANYYNNTVSVIDGTSNTVVATVPVGSGPDGVGVNPTTHRVYVANYYSDNVSVIDGASNTVVATVPAGSAPGYVGVNSTTNRVYVTSEISNTVSVIDGASSIVVATVSVGKTPYGVGVNPTTNRVYVSNFYSDNVSVIDGASNTIVATVPVGSNPIGVGVSPTTHRVYVANYHSDTVSVIDGASNTVVATVPVGSRPNAVGVNPTTNRVYVANEGSNIVSVIQDGVGLTGSDTPGDVLGLATSEAPATSVLLGGELDRGFQMPYQLGESWVVVGGFSNGSGNDGRDKTSPHYYKNGGALDFAPRNNMRIGEDTKDMWVVAIAPGTVIDKKDCYVQIDHNSVKVEYYHLANVQGDISIGKGVFANQKLGVIANNSKQALCNGGRWEAPHLHFKIYPNMEGQSLAGWVIHYDPRLDNPTHDSTTFTKGGSTFRTDQYHPLDNPPNIDTNKAYNITSVNSGKLLGLVGISVADGARVTQEDKNGATSQKWRFEFLEGTTNVYRIRSALTDKCLTVNGASLDGGAEVFQWTCNDDDSQKWKAIDLEDGQFKFEVQHSKQDLAIAESSLETGARLIQWSPLDIADQKWMLQAR